ncbi:MAG: flagellar filament capping protein FliD [Candidatus Delongbacteria bacterium]|nr:flagellar filament capping protein FliD [Candidatus Delongbacteria bacterium]MBN2835947.1 flagellar filament capping protein FliD [Candidatus Delongbacteria bacterium]
MADTQITGLSSGIQWKDTVDQLMEIEKQPLYKKQERVKEYESKKSAWSQINTQLAALKTTLESMDTLGEMSVKQASSSDGDFLGVTASESATPGTYSVEIKQLANGHKLISEGYETTSDPIFDSAGTFTITGSSEETITLNVTTSTNLSDLKKLINNNTDSDIVASIMNDGENYRLILTSKESGLDSQIELGGTAVLKNSFRDVAISDVRTSEDNIGTAEMSSYGEFFTGSEGEYSFKVTSVNGGSGTGTIGTDTFSVEVRDKNDNLLQTLSIDNSYSAGDKIEIQDGVFISFGDGTLNADTSDGDNFTIETSDPTARDAIIEIENIVISKNTNSISDVIEGVTLSLHDITEPDTTVKITVDNDITAVKSLITDFKDKYNSVINTIHGYQKWDEELKEGGPLFGDSRATDIINNLYNNLSNVSAGIDPNQYNQTLSQIGVAIKSDGMIEIDSSKLDDALSNNFDEVAKLFAFDYDLSGDNEDKFIYKKRSYETVGGSYDMNVTVLDGKIVSAQIGGVDAKIESSFITGKEGSGAQGLMMEINTETDGTFTSTIRLSTGKNVELINSVNGYTKTGTTSNDKGKITFIKESIDSTIENLNDQISAMETRLEKTRELMEKKWLAMETALTNLKSQSARVEAMQG